MSLHGGDSLAALQIWFLLGSIAKVIHSTEALVQCFVCFRSSAGWRWGSGQLWKSADTLWACIDFWSRTILFLPIPTPIPYSTPTRGFYLNEKSTFDLLWVCLLQQLAFISHIIQPGWLIFFLSTFDSVSVNKIQPANWLYPIYSEVIVGWRLLHDH